MGKASWYTDDMIKTAKVVQSHRAVIRCKYLGPTGTRGSRIKVARFESGRDPYAMTVSWDDALDIAENYEQAVRLYIDHAGWNGKWVVSTTTNGAVAVCVPAPKVIVETNDDEFDIPSTYSLS